MRQLPVTLIMLALLMSACATTDDAADSEEEDQAVVGDKEGAEAITDEEPASADEGAAASGADGTGDISSEDLKRGAIDKDSGPLSKRVVYFSFDSSEISDEYGDLLQAHGEYLGANPDVTVTVQGHTDQRGSREYNLALGERRARAVQQVLTLNGAREDQVKTISYGEEKPAAEGSGEQAWSKNRRAKLVYSR